MSVPSPHTCFVRRCKTRHSSCACRVMSSGAWCCVTHHCEDHSDMARDLLLQPEWDGRCRRRPTGPRATTAKTGYPDWAKLCGYRVVHESMQLYRRVLLDACMHSDASTCMSRCCYAYVTRCIHACVHDCVRVCVCLCAAWEVLRVHVCMCMYGCTHACVHLRVFKSAVSVRLPMYACVYAWLADWLIG